METIFKYLKQPSTWKGIIGIITGFGVALTPDQVAAIVAAGVAVIGLIDVFMDEDK
jgi:hypothetical protein